MSAAFGSAGIALLVLVAVPFMVAMVVRRRDQAGGSGPATPGDPGPENAAWLRHVVDSVGDAVVAATFEPTGECKIATWNRGATRMFGYADHEVLGLPLAWMCPEAADELDSRLASLRQSQPVAPLETICRAHDGRCFHMALTLAAIVDDSGQVVGVSALVRDVSEPRRVEAEMRSALTAKEVLLREIHHRVKNNLQIISSLLSMQSKNVPDAQSRQVFRESQNRVRSMAAIHEKLAGAVDLGHLDFGAYIRELMDELFKSFGCGPEIGARILVDEIFLDIDRLIPCGLIVTELVTNALKYAFPDDRPGEILVHLGQHGDVYRLTVQDNGVGLPPEIALRTQSLGLQIVHTLTGQLGGNLDIVSSPDCGTTYRIGFPR